MPLLIIVGGVILVVLVVGWIQNLRLKHHTRQLARVAEVLGFAFSEEGDPKLYGQAHRFLLFSQGRTGKIKNLMQGRRPVPGKPGDTVDVAVFEYTFTTPYGRYVENWRQTVVRIHDPEMDLPTFSLTPEAIFNAMLENAKDPDLRERLVGTAGLSFPQHPDFEEATHVQGPDRMALRPLFTEDVIAYFEDFNVVCTEASGPYLLFYRYDNLLKPEEVPAFLERAMDGYELLRMGE